MKIQLYHNCKQLGAENKELETETEELELTLKKMKTKHSDEINEVPSVTHLLHIC